MTHYEAVKKSFERAPRRWLVTGCAGFIGSHLIEMLLKLGQNVTGLDNFATGYRHNLDEVREIVGAQAWQKFKFIEGNIARLDDCKAACKEVDFVLHHAALGSVPRSIEDPINANEFNVSGFVNMLVAARDSGVSRFVYAASSSTYGDHPGLPKVEHEIGNPLSPYAVTKYVNELYADVFFRCYGLNSIGLRYFNIFGARQDPEGAYAAVIPCWISAMIRTEPVYINGDGETTRDFCYVDNAVQANLLSAASDDPRALNQVYNIAVNERTSLNALFDMQKTLLLQRFPRLAPRRPEHRDFREGDVRHSQADITKAKTLLGYAPTHRIREGLTEAMDWYVEHLR